MVHRKPFSSKTSLFLFSFDIAYERKSTQVELLCSTMKLHLRWAHGVSLKYWNLASKKSEVDTATCCKRLFVDGIRSIRRAREARGNGQDYRYGWTWSVGTNLSAQSFHSVQPIKCWLLPKGILLVKREGAPLLGSQRLSLGCGGAQSTLNKPRLFQFNVHSPCLWPWWRRATRCVPQHGKSVPLSICKKASPA